MTTGTIEAVGKTRRARIAMLAFVLSPLLALLPAASAAASVYTVTVSSSDVADPTPNNGICDVGGGVCTLRAAVQTANGSGAPAFDTINVPFSSMFPTYTLNIPNAAGDEDAAATGDLDLTTSMEIVGTGAGTPRISGDVPTAVDRMFEIPSGNPTVRIANLRIMNGDAPSGEHGGAIKHESGSLTIEDSLIRDSLAAGAFGKGGGIYSAGATSLTLTHTDVTENSAAFGANAGAGGGIYTTTPATLTRSAIYENTASFGCSTPSTCGGAGGGLAIVGGSTISNVSIVNNTAWAPTTGAGAGGGIYHLGTPLTITNSTIADNTARGAVGIGGGNIVKNDDIFLRDTIVANGMAPDQGGGYENCDSDTGFGTYFSLGNNLESFPGITVTQCGLTPGSNGDLLASDPGLDTFGDNGGGTSTYSLDATSPAVNAGGPNGPSTDQRGVARPQGARCDIGAFELDSTPPGPGFTCAGPPPPGPPATGTSPAAAAPTTKKKCKKKRKRAAAAKKCKKKRR